MSNEKYVNYYVEILTNTLTDAVIRNVSLQANAKISEDVIKEQLVNKEHQKYLEDLVEQQKKEIDNLKLALIDFQNLKTQVQHIDTYRNELLKCRESVDNEKKQYEDVIKKLNEKIDYLQLTPAKRKKLDEQQALELKKQQEKINQPKANIIKQSLPGMVVKDGGSF